jgi:hypothetical protein|tara:strand:- start:1672 stop:2013 length:342 start_codon:yes stop_codon:yes gene_type:complete
MATYYTLDKINEIADNDADFIKVLVQTFLEEIPEDLEKLTIAVENNNKEQAYQTAHKMKPTIELFGLNYFDELLVIQDWGNKINQLPHVTSELSQVKLSVQNASTELRKDFNL